MGPSSSGPISTGTESRRYNLECSQTGRVNMVEGSCQHHGTPGCCFASIPAAGL